MLTRRAAILGGIAILAPAVVPYQRLMRLARPLSWLGDPVFTIDDYGLVRYAGGPIRAGVFRAVPTGSWPAWFVVSVHVLGGTDLVRDLRHRVLPSDRHLVTPA